MYLVTAAEMQAMDRMTIEHFGIPGRVLMENAGREAARVFLIPFLRNRRRGVAIAAGRGNNGGDGHVMARYLSQNGYPRHGLPSRHGRPGPGRCRRQLQAPVRSRSAGDRSAGRGGMGRPQARMRAAAVWVDAIFGIGLDAAVDGFTARHRIHQRRERPVFAVDMPSGLDADTGLPCGACISAGSPSPSPFPRSATSFTPAPGSPGRWRWSTSASRRTSPTRVAPRQCLLRSRMRRMLPNRPADAHKGRTGHSSSSGARPARPGRPP